MNKKQQPFFNPELSGFCSQMAMILHSGISPLEGITIMLEDSTSDREKDILQQILDTLQETADFSLSLKETGLFPSYLVHMVQIGEETGTLDEVMSALSEHYEREDSIAKSIRNAVTYPMIMIGMMLVVILVLLVKVMPIFNQVFVQLGTEMTGFSGALMHIGNAISRYSVVLIILLAAIAAALFFGSRTEKGKAVLARFAKHFRFFSSMAQQQAGCRFADVMNLALRSGLTPERGLELAAMLNQDPDFQVKLETCQKQVNEGEDLSHALFPPESSPYLRPPGIDRAKNRFYGSGHETGIRYVSGRNRYPDQQHTGGSGASLIIGLSLIVGIILLSVMLPLMGIMSGI